MRGLPGGTVTFLFTDVEGSTRLYRERSDASLVLAAHLDALVKVVEGHGGVVFATAGDGLGAAFHSAKAAVEAALDGQAQVVSLPVRVRMGLHTGEVEPIWDDYQAPVVNRAARVMAAAHGGQVVASDATVSLLAASPATAVVRELGGYRLRDVAEPIRLFQLDPPGRAASSFPPLRGTQRLAGRLPMPVSSFVGRDREVNELARLMGEARVVTITGPGGVGKTRVALQAASAMIDGFDDVWFVELAPVGERSGVGGAIAAAVGAWAQGDEVVDQIASQLSSAPALLVVDNCEHVIDGVAEIVDGLLPAAAGLRVLATSREPLGVDGEHVVPLRPMPTDAAVALFVERALALDAELVVDHARVAEVVTRLDGIPLAIELAAARTTSMAVDELVARLDSRLRLLAGGRRRRVERHTTMRAALDWSYDLLTGDEQALLRRLAVFPASFTIYRAEGVQKVGSLHAIGEVADVLDSLVRKSLVQALLPRRGHRYFRLLETVRAYALEHLAEAGETAAAGEAHADWLLATYRRMGLTEALDSRTADELHELVELRYDIRAALEWALAGDDLERAVRLAAPHPSAAATLTDAADWADLVLQRSDELTERDCVRLHVVAAEGKLINGAQISAAYPHIDAALAIGADDEQRVHVEFLVAQRSWYRDGDPQPVSAFADAETKPHPADRADVHYYAATLFALAGHDPEHHFRRAEELINTSGRISPARALAIAATARWRARQSSADVAPLLWEALTEARTLPSGPVRASVVGIVAGSLAALDPDAAHDLLIELIEPHSGDINSPSDIVKAAIGTVLYLNAIGRDHDAAVVRDRALALPGADRLFRVYAPHLAVHTTHATGTHRDLLDMLRTLLHPH